MAYQKTNWQPTLRDSAGNIKQHGTALTAENLNKMEDGIAGSARKEEVKELTVKLADTTTQLAEKAKVSDVRMKGVPISQVDVTEEFRQQIAGTAPINATPARDSIDRSRMAKGSITPETLAFAEKPNNLFNKFDTEKGFSISTSTGLPTPNVDYAVSGFVYVKGGEQQITKEIARTAFYDETQQLISTTTSASYTVPQNAHFARYAMVHTRRDIAQVNAGTVLLPYDDHKFTLKTNDKFPIDIIPSAYSVDSFALKRNSVSPEAASFLKKSANLFNRKDVITGKIIDPDGNLIDNANYATSADYIQVTPEMVYSKTPGVSLVVSYHDKDKRLTRRQSLGAETSNIMTRRGEFLIRVSCTLTSLDSMMINEGAVSLPYEKFEYTLTSTDKVPLSIDGGLIPNGSGGGTEPPAAIGDTNKDLYIIDPAFDALYNAPTLVSKATGTEKPLESETITDIYSLYDDLVAKYPNYIKRTLLKNDGLGNPIYMYNFMPEQPRPAGTDYITPVKIPKLILTSGTHGVEKTGVWLTYSALSEICENWKSNEVLEAFRWTMNLLVIPMVSPSSYANRARVNHNGVDINRNFPENWSAGTVGTETYGGTAPLSEPEAQAVNEVLIQNKDALYLCDFHNFFTSPYDTPKNFIWVAGSAKQDFNFGRYLISKMSRKWQKEQAFLANDLNLYGYTGWTPNGSMAKQAFALGINAATFEVCRQFEMEPDFKPYTSTALSLGLESYVNYLAIVLRHAKQLDNTSWQ